LKRILLLILLLAAVKICPQDSKGNDFDYLSLASLQKNDVTSGSASIYRYFKNDPTLETGKNETAQIPVFINEEKYLPDGTYWKTNPDINYLRLSMLFASMTTVDLIAYFYQRKVWRQNETTVFHTLEFYDDWNKNQQMDKFGHFTDAYFTSDLAAKLYRWSGVSGESSVWYGALTGFVWMLQIEVSDGFMKNWGYSWGDMVANIAGTGFYVLQQFNYDLLGGIHPKFSYHKSEAWSNGVYYTDPGAFFEDYEGMTFWLAVNPHHYFPESWKKDYPEWLAPLGIAFGVGAQGIGSNLWGGYKEYYVGLDIDVTKLPILDDTPFLKFLKSEINFIHLPMPVVRISKDGTWVGFHF